ncbi:uncharacterized protein A4U43_C08F33910 [Asparagus officinalis]|nr:uncharacterized protein A4U43_C08F33910 [Asparagus officinalis]
MHKTAEQNFGEGYEGKDVVVENLRQLCVHRVANESNRSWVWWDFVMDFHARCSMKEKKYSNECAEDVIKSLRLSLDKIKECMGDPEADVDNEATKTEQKVQDVWQGTQLLAIDVAAATGLLKRALTSDELTEKEFFLC